MPPKKSFIVRLFTLLFVVLLAVLTLVGAGIYHYAGQVVGDEFIRLNQASLLQLASATGGKLSDFRAFAEQLSVSSSLIELVSHPDADRDKQARSILNDQFNRFIAAHNNGAALMEIYLVGDNGLHVSLYNSEGFTLADLRADPRCAPLFSGAADSLLLPTAYNETGRGVMVYSFQMIYTMRDLLTEEPCGFVVLDLSELVLFSQYRAYQRNGTGLVMITPEGTILSGRDKSRIGSPYHYTAAEISGFTSRKSIQQRNQNGQFYLAERIPGTEWFLAQRMPTALVFGPLRQVGIIILLIITLCGIAMFWAFLFAARRILGPVMLIKDKMEQVMGGNLSAHIAVNRRDEFGSIESAFNGMVTQISHLIEDVKQEERQKRLAELDFLQAQINPHFIHNTLTSIRFMLEMGKTEQAGEMVFYFSKLLRQTLSRATEFTTLKVELDTLESYVSLQQLRYQESFSVTYQVAPEVLTAKLPALLLQPVVENAIFHGVGKTFVHIRITACGAEGGLLLTVEDDGTGMSRELQETILQKDVQMNRVGLRNVHDRIQLNYGKEYGLAVSATAGGGTTITFHLPLNPDEYPPDQPQPNREECE